MKAMVYSALFLICALILTGCPPPPPVTVTLPGSGACTGTVTSTVTAVIAPDNLQRPKLTITICVYCSGTPITGTTGITAAIISEVPLPSNIPASVTFGATNTRGCTTKSFINRGSTLRGQKVKVTVVDSTGATVDTQTVTIQ